MKPIMRTKVNGETNPFINIQIEMMKRGLDSTEMAYQMGFESTRTFTRRIRGLVPWSLKEMYQICDIFNWPEDRLNELFPRHEYKKGAEAI